MNNPLVVGYKGEIGSFILKGLLRVMPKALDIWCIDANETAAEVTERIKKSDVIFLCVPIRDTVDWISEYREVLKDKVIIEQSSLKEGVCNNMGVQQFDVRSMHIMFRPSVTPNLDDRKVGLIEGQFDAQMVSKLADMTQAEVVWYQDDKSHDREKAIQQALTHRTLLVLGEMLSNCNGSTYVSKKVLELRNRILEGDADLYGMIQGNEYLPGELEKLMEGFENFDISKYMAG